jgi:hypothetical protein
LLVNDQSHKIQLKALSRLILRLVNQEKGGYGPHGTSLWSSRSWIPGTKRIHKPRNTTAHKVKPETLSQLDIEACVIERTYYRTVHSTVWGWIYYRTIRSSGLEDKLIDGLVWSYYLDWSWITCSWRRVIMISPPWTSWCSFACANVIVLVILRRASRCSCLDWLFWILQYLCKNHRVASHPFVWIYIWSLLNHESWAPGRLTDSGLTCAQH